MIQLFTQTRYRVLVFPPCAGQPAAPQAGIDTARQACGWSLKELAAHADRDPQVARWITGDERPHFDVLFRLEPFQTELVIALARLSRRIEITTQLAIRRSA